MRFIVIKKVTTVVTEVYDIDAIDEHYALTEIGDDSLIAKSVERTPKFEIVGE